MAAPCAGAAIPRWEGTGNWGKDTCRAGPFGAREIGVMAGTGLEGTYGAGTEVAGGR